MQISGSAGVSPAKKERIVLDNENWSEESALKMQARRLRSRGGRTQIEK